MEKAIEQVLADISGKFAQNGIAVEDELPIQYGLQLRLSLGSEKAVLNIYHSEKKGISLVIGGKKDTQLHHLLKDILQTEDSLQSRTSQESIHDWEDWVGSDESGKGDYFGPLVVCAFRADKEVSKRLWGMGVMDSKLLKDQQIQDLALKIYKEFPGRMNGIVLKNPAYNRLIEEFKTQGRSLNDLLAWQHYKVISELINQGEVPQGILVDQFSKSKKLSRLFQSKEPKYNVVERPRAESDAAVAAASILARYQYISMMKSLRKKYKLDFALGGSTKVDDIAREYVKKYSKERLGEVVKLHFKNTMRIYEG